jgi:succinate dehydrogenase/fumarate reductase flavoprotein subunit
MALTAFTRGIPLRLSSPIVGLRREAQRIVGAVVDKEGRRLAVTTRLGVVLACGGFPGNDELTRRLYAHRRAGKNHATLPPRGNAGDGLRLAQTVGGRLHDAVRQPAAWTPVSLVPQPDGSLVPFPHFYERGKPGYISVDRRGRRFVNESTSYHVYVPKLIEACGADPVIEAWIVCDHGHSSLRPRCAWTGADAGDRHS